MTLFPPFPALAALVSGARRKPTLILLWAPLAIVTWRTFGSPRFYLAHLAPAGGAGPAGAAGEIYAFGTALALLGGVSLALIRFALGERAADYGVGVGDWRFGSCAVLLLAPAMVALSAVASGDPQFAAQYPLWGGACGSRGAFALHAAAYLAYYVGFELFFRGFVQFGLREDLGDWNAVLVQTALSTLMHIGKPTGEVYAAALGGIVFGLLAFRARSLLPVIAVHWVLGVSLDLLICLR